MPEQISDAEKLNRQRIVNNAINSVALEGFEITEEQKEIYQRYVNGELTYEELSQISEAEYGS